MINKFKCLFCLLLLIVQLIPVSLVFAETDEDTVISEMIKSSTVDEVTKEKIEKASQSNNAASSIPIKYKQVEQRYEDQILPTSLLSKSSNIAVIFEQKEIDKQVTISGKIQAYQEVQKDIETKTYLIGLRIQKKIKSEEWQDHYLFETDSEEYISEAAYPFSFNEAINDAGIYQYRLLVDYRIDRLNESDELHRETRKGMVDLGSVEILASSPVLNQNKGEEETPVDEPNSEQAEKPVDEPNLEQVETTKIQEPQQEIEEEINDFQKDIGEKKLDRLGNTSVIPEISGIPASAFAKGMGIIPMASNNAVINHINDSKGGSNRPNYVDISPIDIIEAKFTSRTRANIKINIYWHYFYSAGSTYDFHLQTMDISNSIWRTGASTHNNYLSRDLLLSFPNNTYGETELGVVDNNAVDNGFVENGNWRSRIENSTTIGVNNLPVDKIFRLYVSVGSKWSGGSVSCNREKRLSINAPDIVDLTTVSIPNFTAIDGNVTTVNMAQGSYTGDISDNLNDGILQLSTNNGGSWSNHLTNLNHTNSRNGTYSARSVGGLAAGSEYLARVGLKDWMGTTKYSGSRVFYTPNSVNQPGTATLNTPTAANNATATLAAMYNTGTRPAHPNSVEVQRSTNNSTWTTVSASPTIITGSKRVSYTLTGLVPNTTYYTRYRVKNASNKWSPWSLSRSFVTKGVALKVTKPTVNQAGVTTSQITMNAGTYTGNTSTNTADKNTGIVRISANNGSTWTNKSTTLVHGTTLNGSYNAMTITGLAAGSAYRIQVALKDSVRAYQYSDQQTFYTPNAVSQPSNTSLNTPTTVNNATASFKGTYTVGTTAAHATSVEVQRSTNNSTWANVLANPTINTSSKEVVYTLTGLAPNTTYYTRYRVRNASTVWSAWSSSRSIVTNGVALAVSTPGVNQSGATTSQITMNAGTYTGNTSTNTADRNTGIVRISDNNGSSWTNKVTTLGHAITLGGTYNAYNVSGLIAGSTYRLQVGLKDTSRTYRYSGQRTFHTPNTANKPNPPSLSIPNAPNTATATFTASYVTGTTPAHPTGANVKVQVSENGGPYQTASLAATPTVNTGLKQVSFTVIGLKAKMNYRVKYSVLNASTVWSNEAESDSFMTRGIGLIVNTPTFDQTSADSSSIKMNQEYYTGDIFQVSGQGRIEVTGNDGGAIDIVANNLDYSITRNGSYYSKTITGLKPGTKYQGTVAIKDSEGAYQYASKPSKWSKYFYTKNVVNQPAVSAQMLPSNMFDAKASFIATYEAGDSTGKYTPAHPNEVEVEISTDNSTWKTVGNNTSPKLTTSQFTDSARTVDFSLEKLRANTNYYVRYRVKNDGGWSNWSASRDFTTLGLSSGLYITDLPTFNFGMLQKEHYIQTATLSNDSVKNHLVIDNSDTTIGWSLSAKLEPLKRTTDAQVMPWATMRMDINLQNTTDGGTSWQDYTTGVTGSPGKVTLDSGAPSKTLWSINIPDNAQGTFRNEIDWTSVELEVPADQEGYYQGKLVWSLNSIP